MTWPWRSVALGVAGLALLASPWWGRRLLSEMAFFRVRTIEIVGVRYLSPNEVVRRLRVDTLASVWMALDPLVERVEGHPQVRAVSIERKLPGTLVVHVTENLPVALVPAPGGFRAVDGAGHALPIEPSRASVDLPIVARQDTAVLRLLDDLRVAQPGLFARISEIRRAGGGPARGELVLQLARLPVRVMADVTAERLAELAPVEQDLARRQLRVAEIDLRFRDQVIARVQ